MSAAPQPDRVHLTLPAFMDLRAAGTLARDLLALRGRPISLDASAVERLGGLGLQVLLSARLTWQADRNSFALVEASEAFLADCALMGAPTFDDSNGAAS